MFGLRSGGGRRTKGSSVLVLAFLAAIAGWKFVAEPAMIRGEEWSGTIVKKETGRSFLSSRSNRRQHYYLTVDCGDKIICCVEDAAPWPVGPHEVRVTKGADRCSPVLFTS